eukprot:14855958-Alexandrium_andersonii.AAC.1
MDLRLGAGRATDRCRRARRRWRQRRSQRGTRRNQWRLDVGHGADGPPPGVRASQARPERGRNTATPRPAHDYTAPRAADERPAAHRHRRARTRRRGRAKRPGGPLKSQ